MNDQEIIEYYEEQVARLINEAADLQNERDALAAQVELMRLEFNDARKTLQFIAGCGHDSTDKEVADAVLIESRLWISRYDDSCFKLNPKQCLAEIRAEAGEIGYYNGFKDALVIEPPLAPATGTSATIDFFAYRVEQASRYAANQYSNQVRQGGE